MNISKPMTISIGGFMGVAKTTCSIVVNLEKDQFYPGEQVKVSIDCDNSRCKNSVKSFKIKLQRNNLALGYGNHFKNT